MLTHLFAAPLTAVLLSTSALAGSHLTNDFENGTSGQPYSISDWAAAGFSVANGYTPVGWQERSTVDTTIAHEGDKSLRLLYPEGKIDPDKSGASAAFALTPQPEYYLSYWVRFSDGYSWGTTEFAGKVGLGLTGGASCSGGQQCTGTNGFSSRFIWGPSGRAGIYYYSMGHDGTYGDFAILRREDGSQINFPTGQWLNLTQRVKVNTVTNGVANADGEIEVFYNGVSAAEVTGLRFVTNGDQVDKAYFSSFAGGGTAEFAPTHDNYIWYDDVEVSTNPADISILAGQ